MRSGASVGGRGLPPLTALEITRSGGGKGIRSIEGYGLSVTYTFCVLLHRSKRIEMHKEGTMRAQRFGAAGSVGNRMLCKRSSSLVWRFGRQLIKRLANELCRNNNAIV